MFLSHAMPGSTNCPFSSERFRGKSANGSYGDAVEELDWSTGEILSTLKRLGIDDRTLVIFTSDNGATRISRGSNLPWSGWGYTTAEGGQRVPFIARWPGKIPRGKVNPAMATLMDLYPTFAGLAGASVPRDRSIDGKNIWPLLSGANTESPHEAFYYYYGPQLQAVRAGKWKLLLPSKARWVGLTGKIAEGALGLTIWSRIPANPRTWRPGTPKSCAASPPWRNVCARTWATTAAREKTKGGRAGLKTPSRDEVAADAGVGPLVEADSVMLGIGII
jgi:hypothetical protein